MLNARKIFERFQSGSSTKQEQKLIEKWWLYYRAGETSDLSAEDEQRVSDKINKNLRRHIRSGKKRIFIRYAAAVLLVVAAGLYFYSGQVKVSRDTNTSQIADITPGTNRATLTLADGEKIELSSSQESILVGDRVTYPDGTIVADEALSRKGLHRMSVSTPKGGQYQILLPDGTQVWLNADSRLTYPAHFDEKYRDVEFVGEGYFKVAHNNKQPFRIKSQGQQIEVLGTEFNIAAYPDEQKTKTTLVSGAVKVSMLNGNHQSLHLTPGQQAVLTTSGIQIKHVDVASTTAWKDNLFVFRQAELKEVLQNLSRWYGVSIDTSSIPDRRFNGRISRSVSLQQVLQMMEKSSDLKFDIDSERRLMVVH